MPQSPIASITPIAVDTYRISVAVPDMMPGGFSFNQYLVVDEMPLLYRANTLQMDVVAGLRV